MGMDPTPKSGAFVGDRSLEAEFGIAGEDGGNGRRFPLLSLRESDLICQMI